MKSSGLFIFLLLGAVIGGSLMFTGGLSQNLDKNTAQQSTGAIPVNPNINTKDNNLQLNTFPFVTVTPTIAPTSGVCQADNAVTNGCTCISYESPGVVCD